MKATGLEVAESCVYKKKGMKMKCIYILCPCVYTLMV